MIYTVDGCYVPPRYSEGGVLYFRGVMHYEEKRRNKK